MSKPIQNGIMRIDDNIHDIDKKLNSIKVDIAEIKSDIKQIRFIIEENEREKERRIIQKEVSKGWLYFI